MDGQDRQPEAQLQPQQTAPPQQASEPVEPKTVPTTTVVNEAGKPKVEMNDAQVQALLMLENAHSSTQPKHKLPLGLIFTIIVLVILLSMAGPLINHVTNVKSSKQTTNSSSQQNSASQSTTDEVNNDVQQCQNVVNAISEC